MLWLVRCVTGAGCEGWWFTPRINKDKHKHSGRINKVKRKHSGRINKTHGHDQSHPSKEDSSHIASGNSVAYFSRVNKMVGAVRGRLILSVRTHTVAIVHVFTTTHTEVDAIIFYDTLVSVYCACQSGYL